MNDFPIRILVCFSTGVVNESRRIHRTFPAGTAALGRLLTAGLLLGSLLKADERINLQVTGDGPIGGCIVDADSHGHVRGYLKNPVFELPLRDGELDVTGSFGVHGTLSILKDLGLKHPYIGTVPLSHGSLAHNLAYYLTTSEQIPSAIGLSEVFNADGSVLKAGGFLLQALPGADEDIIETMDEHIQTMEPLSGLLVNKDTKGILGVLSGGQAYHTLDSMPVSYTCNCNRAKMESALTALGTKELRDLACQSGPTEITCDFCMQKYSFSSSELQHLIDHLAPGS